MERNTCPPFGRAFPLRRSINLDPGYPGEHFAVLRLALPYLRL